ncbi:FecR family protein [Pinibacter aurantiacus]|uniref:FecR family protein n=1 Tax=Pinibacter aurantiacus TaxID=2851599 RepID=A0A9E2W2E2_9BACT|nr:FecR family protein [Pinibacter aurantiacus]MBV4355699.1 FecR family protein [Pinibacter aurantiacus]
MSNRLIEKFLSGDCTEEEMEVVVAHFKNDPDTFVQYLTEKSWETFQPDAKMAVPSEKMLQQIEGSTRTTPVRKMNPVWIAAASVIIIAGIFSLYKLAMPVEKNEIAKDDGLKIEVFSAKKNMLKTIANNTSRASSHALPDGSVVKLGANSSISFDEHFANNKRDIFLKGEAVFTVAKDKTRPFTVHSHTVAVTALGTVFDVNDRNPAKAIVHLYSGKIVIRKEKDIAGDFKEVYLAPGQLYQLNKENLVAIVSEAPKAKITPVAPKVKPVLNFNKQSIAEILTQLQKEYKLIIDYNDDVIRNMDFTGTYDPSGATVESFLETLCMLNDLTLTKTNDHHFSIQVK